MGMGYVIRQLLMTQNDASTLTYSLTAVFRQVWLDKSALPR
jgi:hypothetical protein